IVALLIGAAFLAGFIDSIAGGGGLITVPAMLLAGFPPVDALGTNKLQGLFGSGSATIAYASKGHVDLRKQLPSALIAFVGAVLGAGLATILPGEWLRMILPPLLIAIALYFAFQPHMDGVDPAEPITPAIGPPFVLPRICFYDGVFGPGSRSSCRLAFLWLAGYGVLK